MISTFFSSGIGQFPSSSDLLRSSLLLSRRKPFEVLREASRRQYGTSVLTCGQTNVAER